MSGFYISIICPVINEIKHIKDIMNFFINSQPSNKELIVIDGGSSDGTREIVQEFSKCHKNITLLDNPKKFVPYALNIGIKASKGDPVVRLDVHTKYHTDYFIEILKTFEKTNADIVGGPMRPIGNTSIQKSIAIATSTILGIGDSRFHNENYEGYVDSVYLGAWKRQLFDEIGYFDEKLKRNQDDEFHYRAKSKNKRIYLNPKIKSWYLPRTDIPKLFKQYYQYGLYKPLVLRNIKREVKLRHLVPTIFVLYLFSIFFGIYFLSILWLIPLFLYILFDFYFSFANKENFKIKLLTLIIYPTIHISYGLGFIFGIFRLPLRKLDKVIMYGGTKG